MSLILVTGGAGFLGSAVALRLLAEGEGAVVLDSFDDGGEGRAHKEERLRAFARHPRATLVRGDATDPAVLERVFAEHRPASVVNAMHLRPGGSGIGPLLEATRASGAGSFVHLSDGRLYGPRDDAGARAREDEPTEPGDDPDLGTKAAEEEALLASGLPFVGLRVFAAAGPGGGPARFPLDALEALLTDEEIVLPDDAPRDFVHAGDVVRGVLFALARRPHGEMVNLGSGLGVRPSELVRALAARAGREPRIAASGDAARAPRVADLEKAWQTLGYSPRFGVAEIASEIVRARLHPEDQPEEAPGDEHFTAHVGAREAPAPPKPVSRRELFDLFRRPFDAAAKKRGR